MWFNNDIVMTLSYELAIIAIPYIVSLHVLSDISGIFDHSLTSNSTCSCVGKLQPITHC